MKSFLSLAVWLLAAACTGCALCQNPWDYCNAVIGPQGCPNCDFGARCGSMFAPMGATPPTTAVGPTPAAPKPAPEADDTEAEALPETPADDADSDF
jgi:hypothetical protein